MVTDKVFTSGNEAAGRAAILAGCRHYYGYPITPQNELTAYMAENMPAVGGVFIQSESELAAISMVHGSSAAGARAMTSSSSPGISLKQEGISYLAGAELPAVIVNVQRAGPGLGGISLAQGDYFQAVKGGGHGDYHCIVLAPASVQEMADLVFDAFDLSDKHRTPAIVLSDALIGQMMEPVSFDLERRPGVWPKPWALTGAAGGRPRNIVKSFFLLGGDLEIHNVHLQEKYERIRHSEVRVECVNVEDAEVIIVAYGTPARISLELVAGEVGRSLSVGLVRPITLWPFPSDVLRGLARPGRSFLVVELSAGQMVEDVKLAIEGRAPVHFLGRMGGGLPAAAEIELEIRSILGGTR
ncbi:MAG: 3-methyl-2-oxobutanoate dehydrogenase subunit VorB [Planctomycetota bacterium]